MNELVAYRDELYKAIGEIDDKINKINDRTNKFIENWLRIKHKCNSVMLEDNNGYSLRYCCVFMFTRTYVLVTPTEMHLGYKKNSYNKKQEGDYTEFLALIHKITERCKNTNYLDNLPKAYEFILSSPFCRDITKLIATKILFFF